jgi:hypothetical protein
MKAKLPKAVSRYMSKLAKKAARKMRGSEAAKIRSAKGVEARRRKAREREAAADGSEKVETKEIIGSK